MLICVCVWGGGVCDWAVAITTLIKHDDRYDVIYVYNSVTSMGKTRTTMGTVSCYN